jgi:hypothetical protein
LGLLAVIQATTHSAKHAEAGSDVMRGLSPEQIQKLGNEVQKMDQLIMSTLPLQERDNSE